MHVDKLHDYLRARQRHEDAHSTGAQVATENLSQDFLDFQNRHKTTDSKTKASFSLFGHSERHQGLKIKTSSLKKSYKSLKTAAV